MIARQIEYMIRCDGEDCSKDYWQAWGCRTRADCEAEAVKNGWVACSRKRWLCPACAEKLLDPARPA